MYNSLYAIIKPIKTNTINRLNKGKKWKYGYNKEHDIVVISKTGEIGDIYEIQNLKIALPKTPKRCHSFKQNKWQVTNYPKELHRIKTIFDGKLGGTDELGNKYYQSKKGKRGIVYTDTIDASKIPVEWYSWMHFTPNKIEKKHILEKYNWQKPHQPNQTGTNKSYHPNRNNEKNNKKYKSWKN